MDLVTRIAAYITRLQDTHPANVAFGKKLVRTSELVRPVPGPNDPVVPPSPTDPDNTIFLFTFPVDDNRASSDYEALGVDADIIASDTPGLCIRPEGGLPPSAALGAYYPYFSIVCRHKWHGRAFGCVQALIHELAYNSAALRQNGVILAQHSQPALAFGARKGICAYLASFKVMAAEAIR